MPIELPELPDFETFFRERTGHDPYRWQIAAARGLLDGQLPTTLTVPTGFGKTSLMIAWVWALAVDLARCEATEGARRRVPLRYVVVVDRRVVVDHTAQLAAETASALDAALGEGRVGAVARIAKALRLLGDDDTNTVEVRVLRGGLSERPENVTHPAVPAVIIGTIDLIGSRLLGRGYGVAPRRRPIEMGLLSVDTILVLDEAHIAGQFRATLEIIESVVGREARAGGALLPLKVVVMTATQRGIVRDRLFDLSEELAERPDLVKRVRRRAAVGVECVDASLSYPQAVKDAVVRAAGPGRAIIVFCNTAKEAKAATELLRRDKKFVSEADVVLLVGGMPERFTRPLMGSLSWLRTGQARLQPGERGVVIVATQTLEVGADLDADVVITPMAEPSALVQRLGRVNRVGAREGGHAVLVLTAKPDPVYGPAVQGLSQLLSDRSPRSLEALFEVLTSEEAGHFERPVRPCALMPKHIHMAYQRTAGSPHDAPVHYWLRPPKDPGSEVSIAFRSCMSLAGWRGSRRGVLDSAALSAHLRRCPPRPDELWTVPLAGVRDLVKGVRFALIDPVTSETSVVDDEVTAIRPGVVLVLPPREDAFGIPDAGQDLVVDGPEPWFVLCPDEDLDHALVASPATLIDGPGHREGFGDIAGYEATQLVDGHGDATGWTELRRLQAGRVECSSDGVSLEQHGAEVEAQVRRWTQMLGLRDATRDDLCLAALAHDWGKRAEWMQKFLSYQVGGDGMLILREAPEPLGKSTLPRALWRRAQGLAGIPRGWRHEAESASLLDLACAHGRVTPRDPALVRHLVLTHHGLFRPTGPVVEHPQSPPAQDATSSQWAGRSAEFADLIDRYGAHTLAALEAIVRLADWTVSRRWS